MRPTLAALAMTALLAQGCIIYEERYIHDTGGCPSCGGDWSTPGSATRPGDDDDDDTDPVVVLDLYFTVASGEQGETMLTTLRANDGFDMTRIDTVQFARDIDVVDQIVRADEIVLVVSIDADATPGLVDAFVTGADDATGLVQEPFEILLAGSTGDDDDDDDTTTTTGDDDDDTTVTGDDDDDTNAHTGDTGCP